MPSKAALLDRLEGRLMLLSALVFAVAFAIILAAHAFESFGGYAPCLLCLEERYAYYFGVPASFVAFFAARSGATGRARALLALVALAFLVNAAAGIYHAGVEWKWWPGPSTCSGGTTIQWGEGGLARELENAKVIRCDEASWRVLGLSFAGWNVVISALLAGLAAYGASLRR
jgi:disulfide bond formation protein DsbB